MSEILGTLFKYFLALLGVGAVIAVLVQAVSTNKAGLYASEVGQLSAAIEQMYANSSDYSTITTANLIAAKIVPSAMVNTAGTAIQSPWGKAVTISGVAASASAPTNFTIDTKDVPTADCVKLVTSVAAFTTVAVAGAALAAVDPGTVTTACSSAALVEVEFTFTS